MTDRVKTAEIAGWIQIDTSQGTTFAFAANEITALKPRECGGCTIFTTSGERVLVSCSVEEMQTAIVRASREVRHG